jgi:hypothetical protein
MTARTLYDKLWDDHVVHTEDDGTAVLYIDRHLVHEVTSPQAFEGLRLAGRKPLARELHRRHGRPQHAHHRMGAWLRRHHRSDQQTADHHAGRQHQAAFGAAAYFPFLDKRQGIVHVIGPEQGATLPGMTVVCGDSHTSTHGAFGALAHGIGTSEVEHVMATQTLLAKKAKNMLVKVDGQLPRGCGAKDIVLAIIGRIGTAGGTGYTIEFGGAAIRALSMEGPHDGVQHGHRGRRPCRAGGGGRHHHRVRQRPTVRAQGRRAGAGGRPLAHAAQRRRRALRCRDRARRQPDLRRRSPGAPARRWCCLSTTGCPIPTRRRTTSSAARSNVR